MVVERVEAFNQVKALNILLCCVFGKVCIFLVAAFTMDLEADPLSVNDIDYQANRVLCKIEQHLKLKLEWVHLFPNSLDSCSKISDQIPRQKWKYFKQKWESDIFFLNLWISSAKFAILFLRQN